MKQAPAADAGDSAAATAGERKQQAPQDQAPANMATEEVEQPSDSQVETYLAGLDECSD